MTLADTPPLSYLSETVVMIPNDFSVELADWSNEHDQAALRGVREQVFVIEQHVPAEEEWDALDARSRHVLVRDLSGMPIGTGRLTPEHMIGRMAVLKEWRGKRVGEAIMQVLLEQARALAYPALEMHAQTYAIPFYAKFGFEAYGDEYVECAIAHRNMRLVLTATAAPDRPGSKVGPRPEVRTVLVESRQQALEECVSLIRDARRELCIYTRDLDPGLLDSEAALDALKHVAISGRGASIRIIVQEPQLPMRHGHRMIELAQRLTSVIAFRTPITPEDLQYPSAFLLNDNRGFYFRALGNRFDGDAVNYSPGRHAQLLEYFNQVWERSEPSEELRQLAL